MLIVAIALPLQDVVETVYATEVSAVYLNGFKIILNQKNEKEISL